MAEPESGRPVLLDGVTKAFRGHLGIGRTIAVDGLSLSAEPGEIFGLVGPNEAGKTTTLRCIAGIFPPGDGRILLDGHDLRDMKLSSLAGQIGMVTQETYLFHDTIRNNLLYARPDATEDEVWAALEAAQVERLEGPLDAPARHQAQRHAGEDRRQPGEDRRQPAAAHQRVQQLLELPQGQRAGRGGGPAHAAGRRATDARSPARAERIEHRQDAGTTERAVAAGVSRSSVTCRHLQHP